MAGTPPPPPPADAAAASAAAARSPLRARSQSRGRSRGRRSTGGEVVVRETIVREGGSGGSTSWPTLTKTNYTEWAILMRVKLGAPASGGASADDGTERQERQVLGAILTSVPSEMVPVLAAKENVKMAWDMIKTLRLGVDRVREERHQKLRKEFDRPLDFGTGENARTSPCASHPVIPPSFGPG
ncbi:hypothetical protein QYE76_041867 [Lolium multiflorum]|uniref:DUF4219 domain-containing protein n=1 Tax=Lolium multiflorum TaxID=4521 RepID=A0AAD8WUJ5_LOLMU|nr:hypothetical protein QYE76_041867 [Lolium multiflorum]